MTAIALLSDGDDCGRLAAEAARRRVALKIFGYDELELGDEPPNFDRVLARFIKGGSLEEITFRLSLLRALKMRGVKVVNSAAAIERTVDKGLASFILAAAVPTPPAWTYSSYDLALARAADELRRGHRLVVKPLFGAGGRGLVLVEEAERMPKGEAMKGVWHLQRFIDGGGEDWRVMVIGGEAVAAMRRRGENWVTNVAQGATTEPGAPKQAERLAIAAAAAIGADYAGVDIIRDANDEYLVLEINGIPGFRSLEETSGVNIASLLLDYISRR